MFQFTHTHQKSTVIARLYLFILRCERTEKQTGQKFHLTPADSG